MIAVRRKDDREPDSNAEACCRDQWNQPRRPPPLLLPREKVEADLVEERTVLLDHPRGTTRAGLTKECPAVRERGRENGRVGFVEEGLAPVSRRVEARPGKLRHLDVVGQSGGG